MPSTCLVLIATGWMYHQYVKQMVQSAACYFPQHDVLLFTDKRQGLSIKQVYQEPLGYPKASLYRYHAILKESEYLNKFDYIYYVDVDASFVGDIQPGEIFTPGIAATLHPGFISRHPELETNKESTAYLERVRHYFAGGFVGGSSGRFLEMAGVIAGNVDKDASNGIIARWHDESHLNKYLYENPPGIILSPSFCYPADVQDNLKFYREQWGAYKDCTPKIRLLEKIGMTECQRCGEEVHQRRLCRRHYDEWYDKFCGKICMYCTRDSLKDSLCGFHLGLVRVQMKNGTIKWCPVETAQHLKKVGLGDQLND